MMNRDGLGAFRLAAARESQRRLVPKQAAHEIVISIAAQLLEHRDATHEDCLSRYS